MLDLGDTAVICEIGVVRFSEASGVTGFLSLPVDWATGEQAARTLSASTVAWWLALATDGTSDGYNAALRLVSPEVKRSRLHEALAMLGGFMGDKLVRPSTVWSQGERDTMILHHAFAQVGQSTPWDYRDCRDARTALALLPPHLRPKKDGGVRHQALADASYVAGVATASLRHATWSAWRESVA